MKKFTLAQVALHNTENDSWMVINGKVYDVTRYHDDHPGGPEIILDVLGSDATTEFEDVGHSKDAVEILSKYEIGTIASASQGGAAPVQCNPTNHLSNNPTPEALPAHTSKLNLATKIVLAVSGGIAIGGIFCDRSPWGRAILPVRPFGQR